MECGSRGKGDPSQYHQINKIAAVMSRVISN